ncbi:MAG: DegT/DnrJ/EryC1/StrS family aminotransferase, partial [Bacillota bacterium]|nr:DegT/DnrJ/EryC1/StrS family aminotransferase [Bacillota bacterium]
PELAEKARLLRVHGSRRRDYHELLGMNSRLDELQAAILLVKLRHLERWTRRRRELAARYNELLRPLAEAGRVRPPEELPEVYHVYHQYTIAAAERDKLQAYLKEQGIGSMVYYSVPLYRQECFRGFGYRPADYPATERAVQEVLSLPVFPELTREEQERVAEAIVRYYREEKKGAAFGVGLA